MSLFQSCPGFFCRLRSLLLSSSMGEGILLAGLLVAPVYADLAPLDNDALQAVAGQGGADMSFVMQLNQDNSFNTTCGAGAGQTPLENCRLAIAFNNRDTTAIVGGTTTTTGAGYKTWLVFKGIQGYLNFQKIGLDGSDLTYTPKAGGPVTKAAIALTFDPTQPMLIRNFGFAGMALETDSDINEGSSNEPGYLAMKTGSGASSNARDDYASGVYTQAGAYDSGRETAFMGLSMHGNLVQAGTIKIFGCDANHPRC